MFSVEGIFFVDENSRLLQVDRLPRKFTKIIQYIFDDFNLTWSGLRKKD